MEVKVSFFRKKANGDKIAKLYKAINGYSPMQIYYDSDTKFWWIQEEGNKYDPFPYGFGVWRRADAVLYEDYPKAIAVRGTSLAKVF